MQIVAQNWLVLELTNSAFALGVVSALQFSPILLLSVFGGVVADRLPRRQILLATQTSAMILAFVLGILTEVGAVNFTYVMILAVLLGVVNAVDMPTRQAFVVELVAAKNLHNAIALNSAAFNAARLIGPAFAGFAIGVIGLSGGFYLNGVSFLAVIAGLLAIRTGRASVPRRVQVSSVLEDMREGIAFTVASPLILTLVLLVGLVGTFGMNLNVLIPVLARDVLKVGAGGYGVLTSAAGVGALVAAILLAYLNRAPKPRLLLGSVAALGISEIALAYVRQFALATVLLISIGFSMIIFTTLANTALQTATPDRLRGRVMSVYTTVFAGTTPIGSMFAGSLAESSGVGAPLALGGLISIGSLAITYRLHSTRSEQR